MNMYGVVLTSEQHLGEKRRWARNLGHTGAARDVRSEGGRGKEWMTCLVQRAGVVSLAGIDRYY